MNNEQQSPIEVKVTTTPELSKSMRQLAKYKTEFHNSLFAFDFTGKETDDALWPLVNFLIEKGYLTKELQPTELSLQKDYIRYNDGSRQFEDLEEQPALLFT